MNKAQWDKLPLDQKVEQLNREIGALLEHAEENRRIRDELRTTILKRLDAAEAATKELASRVAELERRNDV